MGVSYVGQVGQFYDITSSGSIIIPCSKGADVGEFLIAICRGGGGVIISSVSDTSGNTWKKMNNSTPTNATCSVWYTTVQTALTTSSTITLTLNSSTGGRNAGVWSWRGLSTPTVTSTTNAVTNASSISTGNVSPNAYGALLVTAIGANANLSFTTPSGWNRVPLTTSSIQVALAYQIQPSMDSLGTTWSWSGSYNAGEVSGSFTPDGGDFLALF